MDKKRAIRIAGAGPSGLTAAINLVRAGFHVDVFEKRSDTGKRFHGDLQGLENWSQDDDVVEELRRMGLAINFDCDPFLELTITNGVNSRRSSYGDRPLCYLVKRGTKPGTLDYGLKQQALEAGVNIHFKETIPLDEADIVATGPISKEIFAVDKGIVFKTDYPDTNVFLVNDDAAYKGYGYLLITKGYGCMCTVLFDRFTDLDANYEKCKQILCDMFPFDIQDPTPVAGVGCFSTQNEWMAGRSLVLGEAAGVQDLLWGFGIRTAVESGYIAAQCLIHSKDYVKEADRFFNKKLKATLVSRFIWEIVRARDYALVVNERTQAATQKGFDLKHLYNFGKIQRALYPIARPFMRRRYPNLRI